MLSIMMLCYGTVYPLSHTGCPPPQPYRAEVVKSWWESLRTPGGLKLLFNLLTCWEQLFLFPPPSLSDVKCTSTSRIQTGPLRGWNALPWRAD